ncbi:MAG: toll/interleukin-1 receptor domain-containing protein [Xanthobacteraceae bacterium]
MSEGTAPAQAAAKPSDRAKVFVSYSRKDMAFAQMMVAALTQRGFEAFLDKTDIAPGEPWKERLSGLIAGSDTIVFCISPDSVASPVCGWELDESARLGKRIIPVVTRRIADTDAPPALARLNWVFITGSDDKEAALAALDAALRTDLPWVREHTRLGDLALHWDEEGRKNSATLRGADLDAAERWLDRRPADANAPTELHQTFIRASRRATTRRQRYWVGGSLSIAVAAVALAVFAGISWYQAQSNADAAVEALTALVETTSRVVRPIARLDAVDTLIEQARGAMDRFSSFSEDPRIIEQRARTFLLLAETDWDRGNVKRVHEEAQQALELLDKLAAGGNPEFRYLRARSRHLLGLAFFDENHKQAALAQYQAAVTELTALLQIKGSDEKVARWERELADVNQDLGDVQLQKFNDPGKALAAYNDCYDERVDAAHKDGGGPAEQHDIAWALNKRGDVAKSQGHEDEALGWFTKARDGIAQLGDELWSNILWPDNLAVIDTNIGLIYRDKGQYAKAIDSFNRSATLLKRVIVRDPKNLFRQNSLSWTYYSRAEAQFRWALAEHNAALLKQAHDNLTATVANYTEVINQAPDKIQWQNGRVGAQANLAAVDGFIAQWSGDDAAAASDFTAAAQLFVTKFVPLIDQIPRSDFAADTVEFLDWAGMAEVKIGNAEQGRSDLDSARDMLLKYRSIIGEQRFIVLQPRIDADVAEIEKRS